MPEYTEYKPERPRSRGSIEVICGSMFSGKTEELIRRLKRSRIARQKVEVFKPSVDMRYDDIAVVSHDENSLGATVVDTPSQILLMAGKDTDVVGIDEAQFFDLSLVDVCNTLANMGIRVIVAGLDMDYLGIPFGPMPGMMAIAEFVTKVHAICQECGDPAHYSHRIVSNNKLVLVGEKESYVPLCRKCYKEMRKIRSKSEEID